MATRNAAFTPNTCTTLRSRQALSRHQSYFRTIRRISRPAVQNMSDGSRCRSQDVASSLLQLADEHGDDAPYTANELAL